jgi:hypothetical protein
MKDYLGFDWDIDYESKLSFAHYKAPNSDIRVPEHYKAFSKKWPGLINWWD